jgi:hypothetical protein
VSVCIYLYTVNMLTTDNNSNFICFMNDDNCDGPKEFDIKDILEYKITRHFPFIHRMWIQYVYTTGRGWIEINRHYK